MPENNGDGSQPHLPVDNFDSVLNGVAEFSKIGPDQFEAYSKHSLLVMNENRKARQLEIKADSDANALSLHYKDLDNGRGYRFKITCVLGGLYLVLVAIVIWIVDSKSRIEVGRSAFTLFGSFVIGALGGKAVEASKPKSRQE